jgi:[ribosomal protein S5]-alanine N-acetyltransferase
VTVDVVRSERLELPLLSAEQMEALVTGDVPRVEAEIDGRFTIEWLAVYARLLRLRAEQSRADPPVNKWLLRPIVLRGNGRPVIGAINFHMGPDERGMVEVGYGLQPEYRGRGYAIEAVRALFAWAEQDPAVKVFRASVAPDNERSLNLIAKLGFVRVGEQMDPEDGLELVFEVPARGGATIAPRAG